MRFEHPDGAPSKSELDYERGVADGSIIEEAPPGAFEVYCREHFLDPEDTQSMLQFEAAWPEWSRP